MDPVTTAIIAALSAGVTTSTSEVGKKVIVDAYEALKTVIKQKFGIESDVVKAMEGVEAKPESAGRRETLKEEISAAKADQDPEILGVAKKLIEQISAQPNGGQHIQSAIGSYIAQGDRGSTVSVNVNKPQE